MELNPITITYTILIIAMLLFLTERLRADLVALLVAVFLGVTGVLTAQETFSGFSRSAVITILAIFVLAEGLQRTGVTNQVGRLLLRIAGPKEGWLSVTVMVVGAFLSLFMNNIAAAAVLLPAVSGAARKAGANLSRLLMPLAFGTILGGMATLLTTTNIVVSSLLKDEGISGFGLLDFFPLGIPLVVSGIVYMALVGRHLLPAESAMQRMLQQRFEENNLTEIYRLNERLIRARLPRGSRMAGTGLGNCQLREKYNLNLIAVERNGKALAMPAPDFAFSEGDVLLLEGRTEELASRDYPDDFEILQETSRQERDLETSNVMLAEAVLAPRSELIGQTLRDVRFREKYQMAVVGVWRSGRPIRTGLSELPLQFGDALLLQGPPKQLPILKSETNLIVLNGEMKQSEQNAGKAHLALAILVFTLLFAALGPLNIGEVMLGGALAMILVNVLTMDQAYAAIDWKSIFLVAGMLPMGIAMTKTGAAAGLANGLIASLGASGPLALLAGLVVLAAMLTQVMHGAAVAAVVTPIAINVAQNTGLDPRAMAMAVALATSMAFITPLGHPVNILVMGPAGYRFRHFLIVGLPLTLILFAMIMILLPIIWPLAP